MQHITYSPVDRQFGILRRDLEARYPGAEFNGVDPLPGITFGFADYSRNETRDPLDPVIYWGTVEGKVTDDPSILLRAISKEEYDATEAAEMAAREPKGASSQDIDSERDRRTDGGFSFNGKLFQSRPVDRENILGAATLAHMAVTLEQKAPDDPRWHGGDEDFAWIALDNTLVPMDAATVITFGRTAAEHKSAHTFAARALKNENPIPADFADDAYWPAR